MTEFKNLKVWQKAHTLALDTHRVAGKIRSARYGSLSNQMMRAAMSVPTNIVESRGQPTRRESSRFLRMALNSTTELEYHLLIGRDLKAITGTDCITLTSQVIEVRKMLYGMLKYLSQPRPETSPRA